MSCDAVLSLYRLRLVLPVPEVANIRPSVSRKVPVVDIRVLGALLSHKMHPAESALSKTTMKIIFLDFDGVITTRRTKFESGDPDCIAQLNRIVQATGAHVVLSTSWRLLWPLEQLREKLEDWGFAGAVWDRTLDLSHFVGNGLWHSAERGEEISTWLKDNRELNVTDFVVLDDETDMVGVHPQHVHVNKEVGLTAADAELAIRILGA